MDTNVISLLHQLTANPQMVNQLQGFLSLISNNSGHSGVVNNRITSVREDDQSHTQPASKHLHNATNTSYSNGTLVSSPQDVLCSSSRVSSPSTNLMQHKQSPVVLADTNVRMCNGTQYQGKIPVQQPSKPAMVPESALKDAEDKVKEQEKIASASKQRVKEAEAQLHRLSQRLDELAEVVQDQRKELHDVKEKHQLEIDELKHTYDAVLRRKDEVHQESLRQVIKSRDLFAAAKVFEQNVKMENHGGGGLRTSTTPVSTHASGDAARGGGIRSGAKRERPERAEGMNIGRDNLKKTALERGAEPSKSGYHDGVTAYTYLDGTNHEDGERSKRQTTFAADRRPAPPNSAPAPTRGARIEAERRMVDSNNSKLNNLDGVNDSDKSKGKVSTILIRTASHKRRTPRTPSLTHADRVYQEAAPNGGAIASHSRSPAPPPIASSAFTKMLPGTISVKLASPTPIPPSGLRPLSTKVASRLQPTTTASAASPTFRCGTSPIAAGPTRSPSPVNPKRGSALPRRFIFTGLKETEPERLREAVADLGENAVVLNGDLDEAPPFSTTHVVLRGTPRSVKALCGVVSGKWLVPPEYIYNSHEAGFWLDEYEEGGLRIFPPPLKCQRFLLTVEHDGIREKLVQVIEYGGGEVIRSSASRPPSTAASKQWIEKGVVVIASGDDLLRYATQIHA
ncbi:unnamed protein product [Phytomonas sp. EM1]|nr:unnamed protein product [Phytomonas sp. EM1]|eukprot:CCW65236.1 unnamed protein product [Phytomonas sp. isolate EM1]